MLFQGMYVISVKEVYIHAIGVVSSPELKAQFSFSDHLSSVFLSVNFSHFHFLHQNHWANPTKHGTKHPWVKGIQVYLDEKPHPFQKRNNSKIAKIY